MNFGNIFYEVAQGTGAPWEGGGEEEGGQCTQIVVVK
jgi:hypothetical protein